MNPCLRPKPGPDTEPFINLAKGDLFFLDGKAYRKTGWCHAQRTTEKRPRTIRLFPLRRVKLPLPAIQVETVMGILPPEARPRFVRVLHVRPSDADPANDGQTHYVGDSCPGGHQEVKL